MSNPAEKWFGYMVKDIITGFQGVCTGYCQYSTGCNQVLLSPKVKKDGSSESGHWFDEQRCEIVKKHKRIVLDNGENPGCDIPAPVR